MTGIGNEMQNRPIIVHDEPIILPMFVIGTNSLIVEVNSVFLLLLPISHSIHRE